MSQQLAISYPADYVGNETWQQQLEAIRAAVQLLTAKEVAHVLDVSGTHLSDALHERDRKVWHGRWTHVLLAMLAARAHFDAQAADIMRQIVEPVLAPTPYDLTEAAELTPEEEAAALRRELLKFGEAGKHAVDRVKRKARR